MPESIVTLLLNECVQFFERNRPDIENEPALARFGKYPNCAYIEHRAPSPKHSVSGKLLDCWCFENGALSKPKTPFDRSTRSRSGMYYSSGLFIFSVDDTLTTATLSASLGPRYGRGFEYTIAEHNGNYILTDQKCTWFS